jgi:ABC-type antimicrobial peptide transport system permease subunit
LRGDNILNPLSSFTYYRRHKGQALLLLVLIGSLTLGVFSMAGVILTSLRNVPHRYAHLTKISRIPNGQTLDPGTVAQLRAHSDVVAVLPENGLSVSFASLFALESRPVLGVMEDDLKPVMETCNLRLKAGRLIEPRAAEIVLSEEIVSALDLAIGDVIGHDIDEHYYPTIATELTLVGILESVPSTTLGTGPATEFMPSKVERLGTSPSEATLDVQLGLISYEYLAGHEAYQSRLSNLLIIPRPGRRVAANDFAETLIGESGDNPSVRLETFEGETEIFHQTEKVMHGAYTFVAGVAAVSAALVVGMTNRIAIAQRLPELGLLHAAGYEKRSLIRRLVFEIAMITGIGWGSGLLLSITFSVLLNTNPPAAVGPVINLADPDPFLFTLPIPLAVVGWVTVSVRNVLNQLDTVAIIERGKLSMEGGLRSTPSRSDPSAAHSSQNPLSSWTFYRRHRLRSLALLASTGLMVLAVSFPVFFLVMLLNWLWPTVFSYISHTSVISPSPTYQAVNPAVLAQIRSHPAVADVIPVKRLSMAVNLIPSVGQLPVYGVGEKDLQVLLDVYDLYVGEGHLPEPRSGQIVLTRALARNRGLSVGDAVGRPAHELDDIPTELAVVGLLDSTAPGLTQREGYRIPLAPRWVGFVSYEFVEHHERYSAAPMHALVIPVEGREAEVEIWLEESIASPRVTVETFDTLYRRLQEDGQKLALVLAVTEFILAIVTAGALAILNHIFSAQRRDEFGILHAVGHSRTRLIGRTIRENVGIAGAAWLIGAACCSVLLLGAQTIVYAPRGMSLDLTNAVPWLFTIPIPLVVVAASAGTITWALSRLDLVSIIERR